MSPLPKCKGRTSRAAKVEFQLFDLLCDNIEELLLLGGIHGQEFHSSPFIEVVADGGSIRFLLMGIKQQRAGQIEMYIRRVIVAPRK